MNNDEEQQHLSLNAIFNTYESALSENIMRLFPFHGFGYDNSANNNKKYIYI